MHVGNVPWIVELKVNTQGQGQYYRHAVGQAVLYREFIRNAQSLWPWFRERSPSLDATPARRLLADVETLGQLFDVDVITVDGPDENDVAEGGQSGGS